MADDKQDRNGPIRTLEVVDLRQSMANGGGPACLRLRVVADPLSVDPRFLVDEARLDAIALGALAAIGTFDRLLQIRRAALVYGAATIATIVLFRFAAWYPPFIGTVGYLIFGLAAALWVAALARVTGESGWFVKSAASVGLVSYFMYLFHLFFIEALMVVESQFSLSLGFWTAFIAASALTYAAGLVSWRIFESPLNDFAGQQAQRQPSLVP